MSACSFARRPTYLTRILETQLPPPAQGYRALAVQRDAVSGGGERNPHDQNNVRMPQPGTHRRDTSAGTWSSGTTG